jgi:hypothetical protein
MEIDHYEHSTHLLLVHTTTHLPAIANVTQAASYRKHHLTTGRHYRIGTGTMSSTCSYIVFVWQWGHTSALFVIASVGVASACAKLFNLPRA